MTHFKTLILICILLISSIYSYAQNESSVVEKDNSKFMDNIVLGGNVGAAFGNITLIEFSPTIGYKISNKLLTGLNLNFIYYSNVNQKGYIYGPGLFARYSVYDGLFLQSEFQQSYTNFELKNSDNRFKNDFPMFLVGGGYSTPVGGNSRIGITVLVDLIEDRNSFYQNPIIRGGVLFGL